MAWWEAVLYEPHLLRLGSGQASIRAPLRSALLRMLPWCALSGLVQGIASMLSGTKSVSERAGLQVKEQMKSNIAPPSTGLRTGFDTRPTVVRPLLRMLSWARHARSVEEDQSSMLSICRA